MRKRFIMIFLVSLIITLLVACGSQEANEENTNSDRSDAITLKFAGMSPEDHPSTIAMNELADKVHEGTSGRVNIEIYPANQLGDWSSVYQEISRGTVEMGLITHPTEQDPRAEILAFPFVAEGYENIEKVFGSESYIFEKIQEINEEVGIRVLGFFGEEFGGIGSVEEIKNIDDIRTSKDILVRTPSLDVQVEMMKSLGFQTTSIPFADLYTSLQTGVADAWIGGGPSYNYTSFRDVINYYYQINDQFIATPILMNDEIFQKISEEDQLIIEQAAINIMENSFKNAEENEKKYREMLTDEGIEVIELDKEKINSFAQFARDEMWPKFTERVGEDTINGLIEYLETIN